MYSLLRPIQNQPHGESAMNRFLSGAILTAFLATAGVAGDAIFPRVHNLVGKPPTVWLFGTSLDKLAELARDANEVQVTEMELKPEAEGKILKPVFTFISRRS